jgi:hypothetical protein
VRGPSNTGRDNLSIFGWTGARQLSVLQSSSLTSIEMSTEGAEY